MKLKGLMTVVLATAAFATPIRAQSQLFFDGYCVFGSFQVCASVRVFSEGNTLRMRVWNLEGTPIPGSDPVETFGDTHTITAIGLYHSGTPWAGTVLSHSVTYDGSDITSFWTEPANDIGTLGGIVVELSSGTDGNAGIIGCSITGGNAPKWSTCTSFDGDPYVEFTFNVSQEFVLADTELRWHSQQLGLDEEMSLKCDTGGAGDYPPCVVVPEPRTSLLLASGIVGLGLAARRRRRNQTGLELS